MALFCLSMFTSILGTVLVMKHLSERDSLERKKYIGLWRWESKLTGKIMMRFSSTVTRYMQRKIPKRMSYSCGSAVNPKSKNSHANF